MSAPKPPPPHPVLESHGLPPRPIGKFLRPPYVTFPDSVTALITQAESAYSAGMEDYRAGNLEKAKEDFDRALNLLLESKFDIAADQRLNAEFNKLVEDIHGVELAAVARGDILAERNYVQAPIESFAGLTFPVDPKLSERVQQEVQSVHSDLPLVSNDLVAGLINYFHSQPSGQDYIRRVIQRSGLYQQMILEKLRNEGLPEDLIYLAAGESAFNPFAVSRARCVGIWQFSLGTGQLYGLKKDRWVDEREDPVKSTQAAARHLKDLYHTFGDWYLAMAAYDSGAQTVQKAIEKTGYADFWMLRQLRALPRETENYVPIFLATALVAKDPRAYGFDVQPDSPLAADQVVMTVTTDLRLIAQLINHPVEDFIKLNPSLLRWTTPANDPNFVLSLPPGTKDTYEQAIASIPPEKRIWWRSHKVEPGDTLASLAKKYRVSKVALARANQLPGDARLVQGARLVLPLAPGSESSLVRVRVRGPRRVIRYKVHEGDTLELIADRFDVTPYQILRWNALRSSRLLAGSTLRLYVAGGRSSASRRSKVVPKPSSSTPKGRSADSGGTQTAASVASR